uniref:START domain-containing protein n=1 Tax=Elaeophora elaphi TaxID=1147741 RepID=A0A0R3RFG0_9BILA
MLPASLNKYSDAFKKAESAMKLMLDLCTSPSFETREERIEKLTSYCDILKYATTDVMFIKGREFLACRLYRKIGSTIYVAARSFEIDEIPEMKSKVRAEMLLGGERFSPHLLDPQKTLIDYAICMNPKISLPQRLIDTCIANLLHRDSIYARKNAQKLRERNRLREVKKKSNTVEN